MKDALGANSYHREIESAAQVQILDETVCVLFYVNGIEEDMNSAVVPKLWVNSRTDWVLYFWLGNKSERKKNSNQLYSALNI